MKRTLDPAKVEARLLARAAKSQKQRPPSIFDSPAVKYPLRAFMFVIVVILWLSTCFGWFFPFGAFVAGLFTREFTKSLCLQGMAALVYVLAVAAFNHYAPLGYPPQISWLALPSFFAGVMLYNRINPVRSNAF